MKENFEIVKNSLQKVLDFNIDILNKFEEKVTNKFLSFNIISWTSLGVLVNIDAAITGLDTPHALPNNFWDSTKI